MHINKPARSEIIDDHIIFHLDTNMKSKEQTAKDILFKIRRYNPDIGDPPFWQEFTVNAQPGMTVLDGLFFIKENLDHSLAMRYSCRMGVCGSCAMLINGSAALSCNTQVLEVSEHMLAIAPLPNFDIIKDLVPDIMPMFEKHRTVKPYMHRSDLDEMENPTREYYQSEHELTQYLQFSHCIKCGACMAACPTVATDTQYLGPMPLTQSHRYNSDTRDNGFNERKKIVGGASGAYSCHYAGECSRVCPKGVDPARAIQHMKRQLVLDYIKLLKQKSPCRIVDEPTKKTDHDIPAPPEYTVVSKEVQR